ncbi:MAG: hypothetical protein ACRYG2_34260 [Janthinobacterium lividum]
MVIGVLATLLVGFVDVSQHQSFPYLIGSVFVPLVVMTVLGLPARRGGVRAGRG